MGVCEGLEMSGMNRRTSAWSTGSKTGANTGGSAKRRHTGSSENAVVGAKGVGVGVQPPLPPNLAKKRPPLGDMSNVSRRCSLGTSASMAPCFTAKNAIAKTNNGNTTTVHRSTLPASSKAKSASGLSSKTSFLKSDVSVSHKAVLPVPAPCIIRDTSPASSDGLSVSMDESVSSCNSLKSSDIEYLDENDVAAVRSIEQMTSRNLHITDHGGQAGSMCKLMVVDVVDKVVNVDNDYMDPQLCATIACDIYKHLRESEVNKRPSTDFMEKIQKDINASMRAILIDWLVEVAEEYKLVPDTLYLTVNYIDRYLSGNPVNRQRLQLLGVACMMIAAKYEEICAPQVEEFCYITDNTYFKEEVLQMESSVLNFLKFGVTAPTTKCFVRRFLQAAQTLNTFPALQLECLSNYIAELSLLEYNMLRYLPSLIAASVIFLALYILAPSKRPWNSTLRHYTLYDPCDLRDCITALHQLFLSGSSPGLPAIREKYSQHKYKFVAKKSCSSTIPLEYFSM